MSDIIKEPPGWTPPQWIPVPLAETYFEAEDMDPDAWHAHTLATLKACMTGTREAGSAADALLRDYNAKQAARQAAGRRGAEVRYNKRNHGNPMATPWHNHGDPVANRIDERRVEKRRRDKMRLDQKRPTESESGIEGADSPDPTRAPTRPPPTADPDRADTPETRRALERFAADPYAGDYPDLPDEALPNGAVVFCEETDPDRALQTYVRQLRRIGADGFREVLRQFMDDCMTSEPVNRGAALVARLNALGGLP